MKLFSCDICSKQASYGITTPLAQSDKGVVITPNLDEAYKHICANMSCLRDSIQKMRAAMIFEMPAMAVQACEQEHVMKVR